MTNHDEIRPFRIAIPQADLEDLRSRLARTRWPARPRVDDWSRGVPVGYLRQLAGYWATGFDWRAQEAALNQFPQFTTAIDEQAIHFFHIRSPEPDALPLILTHGWPSSPVEFTRLIGPLTDPRRHGGDPADAFHVVLPSLPGYGFSTPIGPAGFSLFGVARSWAELMRRLGYERYVAQGTDVGSGVAGMLPMVDPEHVAGVHLSGTGAAAPFGPALELDGLAAADRARAERFNRFREDGLGSPTSAASGSPGPAPPPPTPYTRGCRPGGRSPRSRSRASPRSGSSPARRPGWPCSPRTARSGA